MKLWTIAGRGMGWAMAGAVVASPTLAAENVNVAVGPEMSPIVKEEFRITKEELRTNLANNRRKLQDLEAQRQKTIQALQKQAQNETAWIEHLRKYDILVQGRYVDPKGDYFPQAEVSERDMGNFNKLFDDYLQLRPVAGRITAAQARKILETGMDKLKDLVKIHKEPTESNSQELALILRYKEETDKDIKKILNLAQMLGFDLNTADGTSQYAGAGTTTNVAPTAGGVTSSAAPARAPASAPASSGAKPAAGKPAGR